MVSFDFGKAASAFDALREGARKNAKEARQYRNLLPIVFLLLVSMSVLVILSFSGRTPAVVRRDEGLVFSGTSQRFRFLGGENQDLLARYLLGSMDGFSGSDVIAESAAYNVTVIRFYATCSDGFLSDRCLYDSSDSFNRSQQAFFSAFDRMLSDAERQGVYVMPVLVDGYSTFTRAGGEVCEVGSPANLEYKRFVKAVVDRYKDRPIVLAWEIGEDGSAHCQDQDALLAWYRDTSAFIGSIDAKHPVSSGEGSFGSLDDPAFISIHSIGEIGVASVHVTDGQLFLQVNQTKPGETESDAVKVYVDYLSSVAHIQLFKPFYIQFGSAGPGVRQGDATYGQFLGYASSSDADGFVVASWLQGQSCSSGAGVPAEGRCVSPITDPQLALTMGSAGSDFRHAETVIRQQSVAKAFFFVVSMWVIVIVAIRTQLGPKVVHKSPVGPQS